MLARLRPSSFSRTDSPRLLRHIHAPLRSSDVTSKAMQRKLAAKERGTALARSAAEDSAPAAPPPVAGAPGFGAWLAANAVAGASMALAFSLVALVFRSVFGEGQRGGAAEQPQRFLDELAEAQRSGGGGGGSSGGSSGSSGDSGNGAQPSSPLNQLR